MSDDTIPLASMFGHPAPMVMPPPLASMSTPPEWAQGLVKAAAAPLTDAGAYLGSLMGGQTPFHLGEAMQEAVKLGSSLVGPKIGAGTIAAMAAPVAKAGARLAPEAEQAVAQGIRAYHGSPHDFDAFDLSKIGTGEGSQAYGHGLYFAENPKVAQEYREKLAHQDFSNPNISAKVYLDDAGGDKGSALAKLKEDILNPFFGSLTDQQGLRGAMKLLQEDALLPELKQPGHTYEVNINAHPDQFLDWDKPLSEQHPQIAQGLPKIAKDMGVNGQSTGAEIVRKLGAPESARSVLREAGIPGIKYLDQGSRARDAFTVSTELRPGDNVYHVYGPGNITHGTFATQEEARAAANAKNAEGQTSNYVVFDPKLIDIIKKYGIGSLAFLGGANAVKNSQPVPLAGMNSQ